MNTFSGKKLNFFLVLFFVVSGIAAVAQPTLSGNTVNAISHNSFTINATSSAASTTIYYVVMTGSANAPTTAAQVKAGQNGAGTTAGVNFSGNFAANMTGSQVISASVNAATNYYVYLVGEAAATLGTSVTSMNFYTLSTPPSANYSFALTAVGQSTTAIDLNPLTSITASGITNIFGYVVMRHLGADPNISTLVNGSAPSGGDFVGTITTVGATIYNDTGLPSPGSEYRYSLVPYNYDGTHAGTYNYNLTAGQTVATGYTFSTQPSGNYSGSLTATASSDTNINLTFDNVATAGLTNTVGYVVLRRQGSNPTLAGLADGGPPTAATYYAGVTNSTVTTFASGGLTASTQYNYTLIPFNYDGSHNGTYNYRGLGTMANTTTLAASSPEPPAPPAFAALSSSATSINLTFTPIATTPASGYLILRRSDGTNPDGTNINDGVAPGSLTMPGGTTLVTNYTGAGSNFDNTTPALTTNTQYNYAIIAYNWDGSNASSYNYNTTTIKTDFDKPSNGATITPPSAINVCPGGFSPLGMIRIKENSKKDFSTTGTIILELDNPAFSFKTGAGPAVAVSPSGAANNNIDAITIVVNSSRVTLTVTMDGNTDKVDEIQITGLAIGFDGTPPASQTANITKTGGTATLSIVGSTYATANSVTSPPAGPTVTPKNFCLNDVLGVTTASATGTAVKWYSDASLSTVVGTGNNPTYASLGITTASTATFTFYVTQTTTCESSATVISFPINALPVADAGIDLSTCSGVAIQIGGSPTLKIPSASGTYTYAWTDDTSGSGGTTYTASAAVPNPTVAAPVNGGTLDQTWNYSVLITDVNGCKGSDAMVLTVKNLNQTVSFTPVNNSSFLTSSIPIDLVPASTVPGGTFSGTGVVIVTNPTAPPPTKPQFNPSLTGAGSFPVTYTVTLANGCTKSVTNTYSVATSNAFFTDANSRTGLPANSPLAARYCNDESYVDVRLSATAVQQIENFVYNWNTTYTVFYGYNGIVFNGLVKNYYEATGIYGNTGSVTYPGGTYRVDYTDPATGLPTFKNLPITYFFPTQLTTNASYPNCASCNYAYITPYVEYASAALTYPDNIPIGADYGYAFNTGARAGFYYGGSSINIGNLPSPISFTMDPSGLVNPDRYCNSTPAVPYKLTGNKPNNLNGTFLVSSDNSTFLPTAPASIGTSDQLNGTANFDPRQASIALGNPSGPQNIYFRYSVDPGTTGSTTARKCVATTASKVITVYPLPDIAILAPPFPNLDTFCNDAPAIDLTATSNSSGVNIQWSGPGMGTTTVVSGSPTTGTGRFTPKQAFADREFSTGVSPITSIQTMNLIATATDGNGCKNTAGIDYQVQPIPVATAPTTAATLCYLGGSAVTLNTQPSSFIQVVSVNPSYTLGNVNGNVLTVGSVSSPSSGGPISFVPKDVFDDAVINHGATGQATLEFQVLYTKVLPGTTCVTALNPISLKIAPQVSTTIAGINEGDAFCSNEPARKLTLSNYPTSPFPGSGATLTITRNGTAVAPYVIDASGTFTFGNIPLDGGNYLFHYDVITGNNCSNPIDVNVYVRPSPVATFTTTPRCDQDVITFTDPGTLNTAAVPKYTWTFEGATYVGQTQTHKFTGISSYGVKLDVEYPPVSGLVCRDSLRKQQIVGPIPSVDFSISDVCKGDQTSFVHSSQNAALSKASWNFGDGPGNALGLGDVNTTVPPSAVNSGTYGKPFHAYSGSGTYTVSLTGVTDANFGACQDVKTKTITILEYIKNIDPTHPYVMKDLDGEKGFWRMEDGKDSTTWAFGAPSKPVIHSSENAWVTGTTAAYRSNDDSYVNSPCFDITGLDRPVISLKYWEDVQATDGAVLQWSVDGGKTWTNPPAGNILGSFANNQPTGQNWYNTIGIASSPGGQSLYGWSARGMADWVSARHSLSEITPAGQNKVRFRIAFASVNTASRPKFDGFAFNNVKISNRNRTILIENFANSAATGIATNNTKFNAFGSGLNANELVKIQYETNFPGADPLNAQNPADPAARAAFYGVTETPKVFVDGFTNGSFLGTDWVTQNYSIRSLDDSPVQLVITPASGDPSKLSGKVTITANQGQPVAAGVYAVYICIVENNLGTNQYVLRKMLPTASGTLLPAIAANASVDVNFSLVLDPQLITSIANTKIVAFVQALQGSKSVLQSVIKDAPATNLVTAVEDVDILKATVVYPVPSDREMVVRLPVAAKQFTPIRLIDQLGKSVHESGIKEGEKERTISTRDFAAGVYILELEAGNGLMSRKKVMIVHEK